MTMNQRAAIELMRSKIGQEIGVSHWFVIDQKRIDQFAACTEDSQWIHTDAQRAAKGPFGKPIAHGLLTLCLIPAMSRRRKIGFDESLVEMVLDYGLNKARFLNPVPVDSRVRSRMILVDVKEKAPGKVLLTTQHTIEIEGKEDPACVAEILGLYSLMTG